MGLRPIKERDWLPAVDDAAERSADRWRLLESRLHAHFACPPDAYAAVEELLALIAPDCRARGTDALREIAARVPDDICLLTPDDPPTLRAAVLTASTGWRLDEKLNRDLTEIHAPVDGLEARIGARMRTFCARLPDDQIFERGNWALYDDGAWDRSETPPIGAAVAARGDQASVAEALWLRTERQTLRRLVRSRWLVFTIRIHRHPVTDLRGQPERARHLLEAMRSLDAEEWRARRLELVGRGLETWLQSLAGSPPL